MPRTAASSPLFQLRLSTWLCRAAFAVPAAGLGLGLTPAWAGPEGGTVALGSASITQSGPATLVQQTSDRAVLDWRSFNLNAGESARFVQPSASSVAVNRIHDASPSRIDGALSANGHLVLINPNGLVFGNGARVDVQGLVASTARPTDADAAAWAAGRRDDLALSLPGAAGAAVINAGTITAHEAGLVGFVAPRVINQGIIQAHGGRVTLASGDTATLDLHGDGLVSLAVSDAERAQLAANHGLIEADGGTVLITAAAAKTVANGVINMSGVIQARSVEQKEGRIILSAEGSNAVAGNVAADKGARVGSSTVTVSGRLDVGGATQNGGSVTVTGDHITLTERAVIEASGQKGGGTIHLGGAEQGRGATATAQNLTVQHGASLKADATGAGDGGHVVLWSDGTTEFHGSIEARGKGIKADGTRGQGGFAETSGKHQLRLADAQGYLGRVDLTDETGNAGTWLLDPANITLYNRSGSGDGTNSYTSAQIETLSAGANVSLSATNDITFDLTGDTLTLAANRSLTLIAGHDILKNSAGSVVLSGTGSLLLDAGNDINFNAASGLNFNAAGTGAATLRAGNNILFNNSGVTTHGGALTLNSDRDASSAGSISLGATNLLSNGGSITLGGGTNPLTGYAAAASASYQTGVDIFTNSTIAASGGNIVFNGKGRVDGSCSNNCKGVQLVDFNNISTTGGGTITFNGIGGGSGGTTFDHGIQIVTNNTISAQNGAISMNGTVTESGGMGNGLAFGYGNLIRTTGTGNIAFTALGTLGGGMEVYGTTTNVISGGDFSYVADRVGASSSLAVSAAGNIVLRPYTSGTDVGVGSSNGTLLITDAFLDTLSWGNTLSIGGYGQLGDAGYIANSNNVNVGLTRSFNKNVNFVAGNYVQAEAGALTLTGNASTRFYGQDTINLYNYDVLSTGTGTITLRAQRNVIVSNGSDLSSQNTAIQLNSDFDANNVGSIELYNSSTLQSHGGSITLGGGANPLIGYAYSTGNDAIHVENGVLIDAAGGNISLRGRGTATTSTIGNDGIEINASTVQTNGSGTIDLTGFGGGSGSGKGIGFNFVGGTVSTVDGAITVAGTGGGGASSSVNRGISLGGSGEKIQSTGAGAVTVTGTGGQTAGSTNNEGISLGGSILSGSGALKVTAIKGVGSGSVGIKNGGGTPVLGGPSASGTVTLITDSHGFTAYPTIQTSGDIVLRPYTAGTTVGVGTGAGTLSLNNALLNNLNWGGTLWLGGYNLNTAASDYVNNAGLLTLNTTRSFAKDVNFLSGANIASGGASTLTLTGTASTTLFSLADINIAHDLDITSTGTGSITERAYSNILYSASGDITTAGGAITLNGDRDASGSGAISLGSGTILTSGGGGITLGGGATPLSVNAIGTSTYAQGIRLVGATLDATGGAGGAISLRGTGYAAGTATAATTAQHGVLLDTVSVVKTNGAGTVTVNGTGGGTGAGNGNAVFLSGGSTITSVNGDISVTGTGGGGASSLNNKGVTLNSATDIIQSTGTGNITVTGTGGTTAGSTVNHGIDLAGKILSAGGNVLISAIKGVGAGTFGIYNGGGTPAVGGATATGRLTLLADSASFTTNPTMQTTGDIVLRPYTAGTGVGIGTGANVSGASLYISDALIDGLTWGGTLWLGGYGNLGDAGYIRSAGSINLQSTRTLTGNTAIAGGAADITIWDTALTMAANKSLAISNLGGWINPGTGTASVALNSSGTGGISIATPGRFNFGGTNLAINAAGSGAVSVQGNDLFIGKAASAGSSITSNSGNITLSGASGITLGQVPITSTSGNITLNGPVTGTANQFINAGTGTITTGSMALGANNLTLTSDDLAIGGALSGSGILTLQTSTLARAMQVNYSSGAWNLSTGEIANLADGWTRIDIGRVDATGGIDIGVATFSDPVRFLNAYRSQNLYGLTATGNGSFAFTGNAGTYANLFAGVTTAGGDVTFAGLANVDAGTIATGGGAVGFTQINFTNSASPFTINSGGGNVSATSSIARVVGGTSKVFTVNAGGGSFTTGSTVNGQNLDITANAGSFAFTGAWGGTTPLGNVSLTSANTSFTMPNLTATGNVALNAGTGTITTGTIATGAGNLTLTSDDVVIGGNLSGTGILTLQPSSASRTIRLNNAGSGYSLNTTELGYLTDGWGQIIIGRPGSNGGAIGAGAVTFKDPTTFNLYSQFFANAAITGTGNASFTFDSPGFSSINLGTSGAITTAGGSVTTSAGAQLLVTANGTKTITTNGGNISIGNLAVTTFYTALPALTLNSGGGSVAIATLSNDASNNSAYTAMIDAGAGAVTFGSTVDSNFNLAATGNSFAFNGAWGSTSALGNVSITSATGFTMPNLTATGNVALNAGTGTITTGTIATGTGNLSLTAGDLAIGGALTGSGALTLAPFGNRTVGLGTGSTGLFKLSDAEVAYFTDGWSGITIGTATNTGAMDVQALTWKDPLTLLSGSGAININGTQTGSGNSSFTYGGPTTLAADIVSNNNAITFNGATVLGGSGARAVNAGSGLLTLNGTVSNELGAHNTTFTSGDIAINNTLQGNGGGVLTLQTDTSTVGVAGAAGGYNLSAAELDRVQGWYATRIVGNNLEANVYDWGNRLVNYVVSNALTISGAQTTTNGFTFRSGTGASTFLLNAAVNAGLLELVNSGTTTQTAAITVDDLSLVGGGGSTGGDYQLTHSGNRIGTLAGKVTTLNLKEADGFTIGNTGNGYSGLVATNAYLSTGGPVTQSKALTATNLDLLGAGAYTLTNGGNAIATLAGNTGSVSLANGNNNLAIGTVNGTVGLTTTGNATLNAGSGTITVNQAIASGTGDLTLTAGDVNLNAAIGGTGTLNLRPNGADYVVLMDGAGGGFVLSSTEINRIADGWSQINIGRAGAQGTAIFNAVTFKDPVSFIGNSGYSNEIRSAVTGTGDASFTFSGTYTNLQGGSVTTAGGKIDFSANDFVSSNLYGGANALTSNGGDILLPRIQLDQYLTLNAGNGAVAFNGTVDNGGSLIANAGNFTFNGPWGANNALGNVSLTSANTSFALPNLTATGNVALNAGTGTITTGSIATGTGNLTLTADDLAIGGNLIGSGMLTLQPSSTNRIVQVNAALTDFSLSTAELNYLVDGWNQITIGNSATTAPTYLGASSWSDPTRFYGYPLEVRGALSGTGNASFTTAPASFINLYNNITTAGGAINLGNSYLSLYADGKTIASGGGAISAHVQYGNNHSIAFDAGSGNLNFTGGPQSAITSLTANAGSFTFDPNWGTTGYLGNVSLTSPNGFTLPNLMATGNVTLNAGTGTITTGSIATGTGDLTLTSDDVAIGGNLSGSGTLTLQPYSAARLMRVNFYGGDYNLDSAELGRLQDGWGLIQIGRSDLTNAINLGASSWVDPVKFRRSVYLYDALTGTGNASLRFDQDAELIGAGATVSSSGATISVGADLILNGNGGATGWSINSNGGDITLARDINGNGAAGKTLTLNAGSGALTVGRNVDGGENLITTAGSVSFGGVLGGNSPLGAVSLTSASSLVLPTIHAASILARTTGAADLTLGAGTTLSADGSGDALVLAAGRNFINQAGAGALSAPSGRWLVYSTSPGANTLGGLAGGFKRYSCGYAAGGACASGAALASSGNGLLYSSTPTLTATAATQNVIYGNAANLSGYGYTLSGYDAGDAAADAVSGSLTGSSTYAAGDDVGSYGLNYASGSLLSALGYSFSYADNASAIVVTPRMLTAGLTGTVSKTYDGTTDAGLGAGNYTLANRYGTDAVALNNPAAGTYDTKDKGTGKTVSVSGLSLSGAKAGNYVLAANTASGAVGTVLAKTLTAGLTGTVSKTYDTTDAATLGAGNYTLGGIVGSEAVTLNHPTLGSYDSIHAGSGKTVSVSGLALAGTDSGNYALASGNVSGAIGTILAKTLTAGLTGTVSKTYDTTDAATLAGGNYTLSNALGSDVVTLSGPTSGTYDTIHAGTGKMVSVSGLGLTGANASDYQLASASASGAVGAILAKTLTAGLTGTVSKTYDGTAVATLGSGNYALNGTLGTDVVALNQPTLGSYDSKDRGTGKTVSVSGLSLSGANASDYQLASASASGAVGTVLAKDLAVTVNAGQHKTYGDLDGALNYQYTGLAAGDATAAFSGAVSRALGEHAGSYAIGQNDLAATGNYRIGSFTGANFTIDKALLTIAAPSASRIYGDANPAFGWSDATIGGLRNGETGAVLDTLTFAVAGSATATAHAGTQHAIALASLTDGDYALGSASAGTLTVTAAGLLVTADDKARDTGMNNPVFTATITGWKNGEGLSAITAPGFATAATPASVAGSYAILASGASANDYSFTYAPGTLTVRNAPVLPPTPPVTPSAMPVPPPSPTPTPSQSPSSALPSSAPPSAPVAAGDALPPTIDQGRLIIQIDAQTLHTPSNASLTDVTSQSSIAATSKSKGADQDLGFGSGQPDSSPLAAGDTDARNGELDAADLDRLVSKSNGTPAGNADAILYFTPALRRLLGL